MVWLRVINRTGADLADIRVGEKFDFGTLAKYPGSSYEEVLDLPSDALVTAKAGDLALTGRPDSSASEKRLRPGHWTFFLARKGGALEVECVQDFTYAEYDSRKLLISHISAPDQQILVSGGVVNPGVCPIPPGTTITLQQALRAAGGCVRGNYKDTVASNGRNIEVIRMVNGKKQTFLLDGRDKVRFGEEGADADFPIQPGDSISVPVLF
ncbi:hypothetical protein BH09VER1_BH09VER1_03120 [soil metagenome]